MDFTLFHLPTYREGFAPSLHAFYDELTEAVVLADRLGWARIIVSEHHFNYYGGAVPHPAIILTAWARETNSIRLAAGVSLVPLRHPIQVAEDYALLDQLSNGRCDMGVSRGFVPHEFAVFGVDPAETNERVAEALDIIQRFWAGEPFAYKGKFTSFDRIRPWPVPVQKKIPIWIAASNAIPSFERIGKGGYRLLMNQYPMTFDSLVEKHNAFKAAYRDAGHESAQRRSSVAFLAHIADTEERAIEEARLAVQEHVTALRRAQSNRLDEPNPQGDVSVLMELCKSGDLREVFRERTLVGTPQQVAERLSRYVDQGFNEAMFMIRFGNITHRQCLSTIERLTREVRPLLGLGAGESKRRTA